MMSISHHPSRDGDDTRTPAQTPSERLAARSGSDCASWSVVNRTGFPGAVQSRDPGLCGVSRPTSKGAQPRGRAGADLCWPLVWPGQAASVSHARQQAVGLNVVAVLRLTRAAAQHGSDLESTGTPTRSTAERLVDDHPEPVRTAVGHLRRCDETHRRRYRETRRLRRSDRVTAPSRHALGNRLRQPSEMASTSLPT